MSNSESKPEKNNTNPPKGFRFLFVLVMLTWLILGIQVMINTMGGENTQSLSMQSDVNTRLISSLKFKDETIEKKIDILETKIDNLSKELDVAIKTYLAPKPRRFNGIIGGLSSNEETENGDKIAQLSDDITPAPSNDKTPQSKLPPPEKQKSSFEQMSFEQEAFTEGLSEVSDRTVLLEEKIFNLNEALKKAQSNDHASNLILASVKLRDAVKSTKDFSTELNTLKIFAEGDSLLQENIAILEKDAHKGAASIDSLKEEFDLVANEIINFNRKQKTNQTFWDKAIIQISSVVKIRKIDSNAAGNQTDDILARAYNHLLNSDLYAAAEEMKNLQENARILADNWLKKVEHTIVSLEASEKIFKYVTKPSYANYTNTAE